MTGRSDAQAGGASEPARGEKPSVAAPSPAAARPSTPGPARTAGDFTLLGDLLGAQPGEAAGCAPDSVASARQAARGGAAIPGAAAVQGGRSSATGSADLAAKLTMAWPQVVGDEVAANSRPVRLRQGRLVVAVSSTMWAQTLQFMEQTIMAGLNERLDGPLIEHIAFRHAGWQEGPARRSTAPADRPAGGTAAASVPPTGGIPSLRPALWPEQEAALRSVEELGLEPRLAEKIVAAMRAAFVREQQASVRS